MMKLSERQGWSSPPLMPPYSPVPIPFIHNDTQSLQATLTLSCGSVSIRPKVRGDRRV